MFSIAIKTLRHLNYFILLILHQWGPDRISRRPFAKYARRFPCPQSSAPAVSVADEAAPDEEERVVKGEHDQRKYGN